MTFFSKNYTELMRFESYEERFKYLILPGKIGMDLFGKDRSLNQEFYTSREWRQVKDFVVIRDDGLDLGCPGFGVTEQIVVHHMNPITVDDLIDFNPKILDPEFLITTSVSTHRAIHYGDTNESPRLSMVREPGDTKSW